MSPELTQYAAYISGMVLTPVIGFAVLGLFWLIRTGFELVCRGVAKFQS